MKTTSILFFLFLSCSSLFAQHNHLSQVSNYIDSLYKYKDSSKYDQAIPFGNKIIKLYSSSQNEQDTFLFKAYIGLGVIYSDIMQYHLSDSLYLEALKIALSLGKNHFTLIDAYHNLGVNRWEQNQIEKAIDLHEKELQAILAQKELDKPKQARCYESLGVCYSHLGNFEKALDYLNYAKNILEKYYKKPHSNLANIYTNIAFIYFTTEAYEKAFVLMRKSLDIKRNTIGEIHRETAIMYDNIGAIFTRQGNFSEALNYLNEALKIRELLFEKDNPVLSISYGNIAEAYIGLKNYQLALELIQKAIPIEKKANTKYAIMLYYKLGGLYELKENSEMAFLSYRLACEEVLMDWTSPNIIPTTYNSYVIKSLEKLIHYRPKVKIDDFPSQKGLIDISEKVIRQVNLKIDNPSSIIENNENAFSLYQTSMAVVQDWQPRDKFKEFELSEASKANVILSQISNNQVERYRSLPDSLQEKDQNLHLEIAQMEVLQFDENQNDSLLKEYENRIFSLRREQEKLLHILEKKHPNYYQLKYDNSTASVEEVQALLEDDQALIEYFVGDNHVIIFTLNSNTFEVTTLEKDFPLEEWVQQMRDGIYLSTSSQGLGKNQIDRLNQQYVNAAYQLHQKLIASISLDLPKRLIIVPDGALGYLPFDALLKSLPKKEEGYKNYNYLLKDHAISYNYSATLYQQILDKPKTKASKRMLAIAPHFGEESKGQILADRSVDGLRNTLSPLYYTVPEVTYLHDQFNADTLTGQNAILDNFKRIAQDYQIIHLSTHGIANGLAGDYSYLAFTEIPDSIENEKLYVRELYNLKLNADMVVLSACETGLGELKRGEGIIGMTRGFLYAGTRSIITTLWKVNDRSTKEFMDYFYDGLQHELPKDVAMQQAKLQLLEGEFPEPYYWAGFIPIGDMASLKLRSGINWWYFLFGVGMLFFFLLIKWQYSKS